MGKIKDLHVRLQDAGIDPDQVKTIEEAERLLSEPESYGSLIIGTILFLLWFCPVVGIIIYFLLGIL